MYLMSFIHREKLLRIAERWFCARPDPNDALSLTEILISDGFVIGETLKNIVRLLLQTLHPGPFHEKRIHFKGELRDIICNSGRENSPRVEELCRLYRKNPDYYYREAPINGMVCLDQDQKLLGLYRIKRPRRIAEKANRKIANWIFRTVIDRARKMAEERARRLGVPIEGFITPEEEMVREFVRAEEEIAESFREGTIRFDRTASTIHDVGGIKIVADTEKLAYLERILDGEPSILILDKESYLGAYQATNYVLDVQWDPEDACRGYRDNRGWERYLDRGIPEARLKKGLEHFLEDTKPNIHIELILSTFPHMAESELGDSIHEERILTQRNNKMYQGYIPMNVEFLLEYLFAVGFSPRVHIDYVPIKLWGRYLPDTLSSHIRLLYERSEYDLFY